LYAFNFSKIKSHEKTTAVLRDFMFAALAIFAQLQNTGWRRPTATHFPNDWTNPQNAFGSDDTYAEVLHQSGCRCPFMDLSGDNGVTWSLSNIFGPYGTSDSFKTQGDSTDDWGYAWTDLDLSDSAFVLRIWNSSTLLRQGYANFGFAIPAGSAISGIEVRVEAHGDSGYTMDRVDIIEAKVYYSVSTLLDELDEAAERVLVFPNPASDLIRLLFSETAGLQIVTLSNIQGVVVSQNIFSVAAGARDYFLDVTHLPRGIYCLSISGNTGTLNKRLVIQ
jgi:hypothetical protein